MGTRFLRMAAFCGTIILGMCWIMGSGGCKKSGPTGPGITTPVKTDTLATPVTITAVSPDTAAYSTTVTITGTDFSATASGDSVYFNGVSASIQQASATQLVVTVPLGAGTGPVKVVVGSKSCIGPVFNYIYTVTVSTQAGIPFQPGSVNGAGTVAQFNNPYGVAVDTQGNVYVADYYNSLIRKITSSGIVSTLAGLPTKAGYIDGGPSKAEFNGPSGIAVDGQGNVYVGDVGNNAVRVVSSSGQVVTLAGSKTGQAGYFDGLGSAAEFAYPYGLALYGQGTIYVADAGNNVIRDMTTAGSVGTFAGEYGTFDGTAQGGYADGNASIARFYSPFGVAVDGQGNVYVADGVNNRIRKVSSGVVSTLAGNGTAGYEDGSGTTAEFNMPFAVAVDRQGNVYVADRVNAVIRKVTPAGVVSTLAGNGTSGHVDGAATTAEFAGPTGIALDAQGNVYVADQYSSVIRKITLQ
jgi:sugar lactone lactonase YvrE